MTLKEVKFSIAPKAIEDYHFADPDVTRLNELYRDCHQAVFERLTKDIIVRSAEDKNHIQTAAAELGVSLKVFFLAGMLGYQQSFPGQTMSPRFFFRQNVANYVQTYRKACTIKFACFDVEALRIISNKSINDIEYVLENSEVLFGDWCLGWVIKHGTAPGQRPFMLREIGFNPLWLATESSYWPILTQHVQKMSTDVGTETARHRHSVVMAMKQLKSSMSHANYVFDIRKRIIPKAVRRILVDQHIDETQIDFPSEVKRMSEFWEIIGTQLNA